jgi:hypothetical protein
MNSTLIRIKQRQEENNKEAQARIKAQWAANSQLESYFKPLWFMMQDIRNNKLSAIVSRETFGTAKDIVPRFITTENSIHMQGDDGQRVFRFTPVFTKGASDVSIRFEGPKDFQGMRTCAGELATGELITVEEAAERLVDILAKVVCL